MIYNILCLLGSRSESSSHSPTKITTKAPTQQGPMHHLSPTNCHLSTSSIASGVTESMPSRRSSTGRYYNIAIYHNIIRGKFRWVKQSRHSLTTVFAVKLSLPVHILRLK